MDRAPKIPKEVLDYFGDVISVYDDQQAVEDGVLVDLEAIGVAVDFRGKRVNRMTGHLWNDMAEFYPGEKKGAVDLERLKHALETKVALAFKKGGVWQTAPRLWLMENELDGWTMMYPEDY